MKSQSFSWSTSDRSHFHARFVNTSNLPVSHDRALQGLRYGVNCERRKSWCTKRVCDVTRMQLPGVAASFPALLPASRASHALWVEHDSSNSLSALATVPRQHGGATSRDVQTSADSGLLEPLSRCLLLVSARIAVMATKDPS